MCVCVCVCKREREKGWKRNSVEERGVCISVSYGPISVLLLYYTHTCRVTGYAMYDMHV